VFTGLVEEKGVVLSRRASRKDGAPSAVLRIQCSWKDLVLGESIAVDGACLTVARRTKGGFEADVSSETLTRTTLGGLSAGAPVNVERSLAMGARLGGHIVLGHVDGTCTLVSRSPMGDAMTLSFRFEPRLSRFIAEKGSVAVCGVSLTVNAVKDDAFDVAIIPHTSQRTTLGILAVGGACNLEVDLLARYLARLLDARGPVDLPFGGMTPNATRSGRASGAADTDADAAFLERLTRAGMV
jgi:riboflavin synthase